MHAKEEENSFLTRLDMLALQYNDNDKGQSNWFHNFYAVVCLHP